MKNYSHTWLTGIILTLLLAAHNPLFAQLSTPSGGARLDRVTGGAVSKEDLAAMQKSMIDSIKIATREMAAEKVIVRDPGVLQVPEGVSGPDLQLALAFLKSKPFQVPPGGSSSEGVIAIMEAKIKALQLQVKHLEDENKAKQDLIGLQEQLIMSLKKELAEAQKDNP